MTSAPQTPSSTMSEDELTEMLSKVKSARETEELRARLPSQLAPFASNISITKPVETTNISRGDGMHFCGCGIKQRIIHMSVTVVPRPDMQPPQGSGELPAKSLKLAWRDWWTTSRYLTGLAQSHMHSITLEYDSLDPGKGPTRVKAFIGWYDDPGTGEVALNHGGIKSVVDEVVRDMGLGEGELGSQLEVLEALLGDEGRQLLKKNDDEKTLSQIIDEELKEEKYD
ncbi:hypothetical protein FQN54_005543 [Arachnomyces sp. PD_36]|nr:hypothetical protein FQN54_005543 [Arachnomyces sp. PD_36]